MSTLNQQTTSPRQTAPLVEYREAHELPLSAETWKGLEELFETNTFTDRIPGFRSTTYHHCTILDFNLQGLELAEPKKSQALRLLNNDEMRTLYTQLTGIKNPEISMSRLNRYGHGEYNARHIDRKLHEDDTHTVVIVLNKGDTVFGERRFFHDKSDMFESLRPTHRSAYSCKIETPHAVDRTLLPPNIESNETLYNWAIVIRLHEAESNNAR